MTGQAVGPERKPLADARAAFERAAADLAAERAALDTLDGAVRATARLRVDHAERRLIEARARLAVAERPEALPVAVREHRARPQ